MPRLSQSHSRPRRAYRAVDWAAHFGKKLGVSPQTVRLWTKLGWLPAPDVRIGKRQGWRRATVRAFLKQQPEIVLAVDIAPPIEPATAPATIATTAPLPLAGTTFVISRTNGGHAP